MTLAASLVFLPRLATHVTSAAGTLALKAVDRRAMPPGWSSAQRGGDKYSIILIIMLYH